MSSDMFGWTLQDSLDAKLYLETKLKAQTDNYYNALSIGDIERDCATEREFDLLKIAIACIGKELERIKN